MKSQILGIVLATTAFLGGHTLSSSAQTKRNAPESVAGIPVNYDEAKVGSYTLPDPLKGLNGQLVKNEQDWMSWRRPEILKWFQEQQYGKSPNPLADFAYTITDNGTPVFGGKAIRKQVTLYLYKKNEAPKVNLLIYLPVNLKKPAPMLIHLSFSANSTSVDDPGVLGDSVWNVKDMVRVPAGPFVKNRSFPVEAFIDEGIGVANLYYGDIEPDAEEGIKYGIRKQFLPVGKKQVAPDEWGAISAWAWGLSRVMDYLEQDKDIDSKRVALNGHSRLGKTVLFAGANDPRFSLVVASCSGEGGAALSRRNYGETIAHLVAPARYPYQFCQNYQQYGDDPSKMEMDSHMLISLIAPRPLLLITGDSDNWSDPKGEFLAARAAGPVYRLFGKQDLGINELPAANKPILHTLGFLMHHGGHSVLPQDINAMIKFMQMNWEM